VASRPATGDSGAEGSSQGKPDTTASSGGPTESQSPSPNSSAVAGVSHGGRPRRRVMRRKTLLPVILAAVAAAAAIFAIALYPRSHDFPIPSYPSIAMRSAFAIGTIEYGVIPVRRSVSDVYVRIILGPGIRHPPAHAPAPLLTLFLPPGIRFQTCPAGPCSYYQGGKQYYWTQYLKFTSTVPYSGETSGAALLDLRVRSDDLGYAFNGVTAAAAIPQVNYTGQGSPQLDTEYLHLSSPNRYDWSAFPPEFSDSSSIAWDETIANGAAQGRVSVGVDHANQAKDSNNTFIAGALIGLAGGALLSAIQEAFRVSE
jgi:hypothetical protein